MSEDIMNTPLDAEDVNTELDAAEEAAKRRYATYVRKTKEDWSLCE